MQKPAQARLLVPGSVVLLIAGGIIQYSYVCTPYGIIIASTCTRGAGGGVNFAAGIIMVRSDPVSVHDCRVVSVNSTPLPCIRTRAPPPDVS